jgi:hypothetical protein
MGGSLRAKPRKPVAEKIDGDPVTAVFFSAVPGDNSRALN